MADAPNPGLVKGQPPNNGPNARTVTYPGPVTPAPGKSFSEFKAALPLMPPSHVIVHGPQKVRSN